MCSISIGLALAEPGPVIRSLPRLLSALAATAALLGAASPADARMFDLRDAERVAKVVVERAAKDPVVDELLLQVVEPYGVSPAEQQAILVRAKKRYLAELRQTALALSGESFENVEAAAAAVGRREAVIRFNMLNDPRGYANGRKMGYRISVEEAKRLHRTLAATYIEREPLLRAKLDEMVLMEELAREDVQSIRAHARDLCGDRGLRTLKEIVGTSFFTPSDAAIYLEYAVDAELDSIRIEKLADPVARPNFIEEAKARYPTSQSS